MKRHLHTLGFTAVALLLAIAPVVLTNDFYLRVIFMAGVYYLVAAGLNVLVGYTGQISLGHAGLFAVGAYTAALLTTEHEVNPWLAMLAAPVLAGLFGALIAVPALRVKGPSLAMVTIGFGIIMEKVVTEWNDVFHGQQGIYGIVPPSWGEEMFTSREWVWLVAVLALGTHLLLRALLQGKYGRAFMAVHTSEIAAESVGISLYGTKVLAFAISAVFAGLAGALVAQQNQYINSDFITFNLSVFFLLTVLFGGGGSLYGPALGALVLTLVDAFLARWPHLQHFVYGALLLFALYIMPKGLAGAVRSLGRKFWQPPAVVPSAEAKKGEWEPRHAAAKAGQAPESRPLLEASGLHKAYGGIVPTRDVSLVIQRGSIHSLIGPNGAGKTTLINILSGIVRPDRGSILLEGTAVTGKKAHQVCASGVARTFQNLRLFADMSVLENVLVGLHPHMRVGFWSCLLSLPGSRRQEREAREEALAILGFVGLLGQAEVLAGSLPYGLQRRLEIARALATHPKLLLLDEPAAGLNPHETEELNELITRIRAKGITVFLVEHHMDLVMAISDKVTVLDYGEKIAEGAPQAIQEDQRVIDAYLGTEAAA